MNIKNCVSGVMVAVFSIIISLNAKATTILYNDEATWLAQTTTGPLPNFVFTANNVSTANEVVSPPAPNTLLGQTLSFDTVNTGLPFAFTFQDESPQPSTQVIYTTNALGVSTSSTEHDWSLNFTGGSSVFEVGLSLSGGIDPSVFRVFDTLGVEVASFTGVPGFLGIISDVAIGSVYYDDTITPGGVVLTELNPTAPVPVPSPLVLLCSGVAVIAALGKKKLSDKAVQRMG